MFDQPPLTAKEVLGRGFVHGLALLFGGALLVSLASIFPSRSRLYLRQSNSLSTYILFVWPVVGTIGCGVLLLAKGNLGPSIGEESLRHMRSFWR
jgi:hypothetical protein